jgi:hypothetical protein
MDLDFEDQKLKNKLKKTNLEYDEYTVKTLSKKFENELEKNKNYFNLINKQFNKNSSNTDYNGLYIGRDNYEILNFEEFLKLIVKEYILYNIDEYNPLIKYNNIIYHGFNNKDPLTLLSYWGDNYIKFENYMSPILFSINNTIKNLNLNLKKHIIDKENTIESINQNFENSFFSPLIYKFKVNQNFDIEFIIKEIESKLNCFLTKLFIINFCIPLAIFVFLINENDRFIFFLSFKINDNDYKQLLYEYINRNIEMEEDDLFFNKFEKNKKKYIEINEINQKENSKIEILRTELNHIDENNSSTLKWKKKLTESKLNYITYGYMTTEFT